ncbi:MAG: hypothetical protein ABSG95_15690 [Solirubrobacteraceae bacterium]|jgi:hypothetical protein
MDEMGHTDPALALRVYAQSMRRGEDEQAQLRALVEGGFWPTVTNERKTRLRGALRARLPRPKVIPQSRIPMRFS